MRPPFTVQAAELELEPSELVADQILSGSPRVRERALWSSEDGRLEVGVWEMTPGDSSDVEVDEVFVVLGGRAVVEIEGGPTLALSPGVVCALPAGARTVWRVTETLRKVYTVGVS